MAGGARELPKWQPPANVVPNDLPNWQQQMLCHKKYFWFGMKLYSKIFLAMDDMPCIIGAEKERMSEKMKMKIRPVTGMYFSAIRRRDDRVFVGMIETVKSMGMKGTMIVVRLKDSGKYASVYLDECFDYEWSDFELPALQDC